MPDVKQIYLIFSYFLFFSLCTVYKYYIRYMNHSGGTKMKRLFKCEHCGNIIEMVEDKGVPVMCCGQKMTELVPNTTDAATEKHVPVIEEIGRASCRERV